MPIDGSYDIQLNTMMGPQSITLTLKTDGNSLSGTMDGHFGEQSFSGGMVSGQDISWTVMLESPVGEMQLDVNGTVNGNEISGQVQLGSFRPTPFTGTRSE